MLCPSFYALVVGVLNAMFRDPSCEILNIIQDILNSHTHTQPSKESSPCLVLCLHSWFLFSAYHIAASFRLKEWIGHSWCCSAASSLHACIYEVVIVILAWFTQTKVINHTVLHQKMNKIHCVWVLGLIEPCQYHTAISCLPRLIKPGVLRSSNAKVCLSLLTP